MEPKTGVPRRRGQLSSIVRGDRVRSKGGSFQERGKERKCHGGAFRNKGMGLIATSRLRL